MSSPGGGPWLGGSDAAQRLHSLRLDHRAVELIVVPADRLRELASPTSAGLRVGKASGR